jgi:hypothetical protein
VGVFFNGFDKRVPHIHGNSFNPFALVAVQLVEESLKCSGFSVFADKQYTSAEIIEYDGQVIMAFTHRNFIHGQDP